MKDIVCIDIDGTLSDHSHRKEFVETKPKNWEKFFEGMDKDPLNKWCWELMTAMSSAGFKIILLTGRPDKYREVTEKWLEEYDVPYDKLIMRKEGDHRDDTIVKKELIEENFLKGQILFVVDDRSRVCEMYRDLGLTCLQCAPGNY